MRTPRDDRSELPIVAVDIDPHAPRHVTHSGYTVLVANLDGSLHGRGPEGLYDFDARILSVHRLTVMGHEPEYVAGGAMESDCWAADLRVERGRGTPRGPALPEDALEIAVERRVGRGMEERIVVRNHGMVGISTDLTLELDADFIDVQELRRGRMQRGDLRVDGSGDGHVLVFDYRAEHDGRLLHRALRVRVTGADSAPAQDGRTLRFALDLPPRGSWRAALCFDSLVDGAWRTPLGARPDGETARGVVRRAWRARRTRVTTAEDIVAPAFEQAAEDLFALRNWEYDRGPDAWFPKAGVPTYSGIFGRDSLTAAWQAALLGPEMMRGALDVIARTRAERDSAWRDEEPGKLIHEIRRGPLSELELIPQRAYYGTQTTPAMFTLALSEYWHWTGDDSLLRRHRDAALGTFDWVERYGDRDGDGFLEYVRRSTHGLKNHAWKDSDEGIRYADGRIVENPIATVEEQAYHFIALQRMAEILVALGDDDRAERFLDRARALRRRWHAAYWMPDEAFYAMALDGGKRPVRSIASNAGHALGTGIVPADHAPAVADRLLAPDLFSGWGVRTLSAEHPSYNPWGYHLGTVWPVENATFALGMKRYGLDEHAERIVGGMLAASARFRHHRLPEALGGHGPDVAPGVSAYPGSNSPQAWSASATVQFVQILLGLYPFAPARTLALVRPRLPHGIDSLTLHNVRVGRASVSLRFRRRADGTAAHEVVERDGTLFILPVPPPQDTHPERTSGLTSLGDRLLERAPFRAARALRIALGHDGA